MTILSTFEVVDNLRLAWSRTRDQIRDRVLAPDGHKTLDMQFGFDQSATLLGRSDNGLRKAIQAHPELAPRTKPNGRPYYMVDDLHRIRERLDIRSGKTPDERAAVIAVQNFKGGVGKSTVAVHLSHYLGLRGYKVLVIDCDPQASTTTLFDINPDLDLQPEETLGEYLHPVYSGEDGALPLEPPISLGSLARDTQWPTIKLIPSNLSVMDIEYEITKIAGQPAPFLHSVTQLRRGIESLVHDYDVIILDPPPAMGFLAFNAMMAASALVIPAPPKSMDFCSTCSFLVNMASVIQAFARAGVDVNYAFVELLCSNFEANREADVTMWEVMQSCSGARLIATPLRHSEEIKHAATMHRSVYELARPSRSPGTYKACIANLDAVFSHIEARVKQTWPSHARIGTRSGSRTEAQAA